MISLGVIALGPALIAAAALSTGQAARRSAFGLLAGAAGVSLFIAYVQRQGPGTTCWHTTTAAGCDQHLDPIPWLVIGLLLLIGAIVLQTRRGPDGFEVAWGSCHRWVCLRRSAAVGDRSTLRSRPRSHDGSRGDRP